MLFDERIIELEKTLAARDAEIAARDAEIAARDAEIAALRAQVEELTRQVAALMERLSQNSSNSHKPPSSDTPAQRVERNAKKRKSSRKRGGQKGHRGWHRELLDASQVDQFVDLYPPECTNCWEALPEVFDPNARRQQVTEVPPITPHTTEYRRHAVTCRCCGARTRAAVDGRIPDSPFGPRLSSIAALLTGVYHVSRRQAQRLLMDLLGVKVSLGAISQMEARVSEAVAGPVDETWSHIGDQRVKHTDGTSWKQSGDSMQLWTIATTMVTVFKIVVDGSKQSLKPLFGALKGILVSDRAKALNFWAMDQRQVCWAHLVRKFVSFSQRDGPAGQLGRELVDYTGILFEYWHAFKSGSLGRADFLHRMGPVSQQIEALLQRGVALALAKVSGSCADILAHKDALFRFVYTHGVEPTNNHAERELRAFVLWRKRCFGSQSQRGNVFAERLMTVAHTARKQQTDILPFLTRCCEQTWRGEAAPSLMAA